MLKGIHWGGYATLTAAGYKWDLRRNGELKLGLWRKTFQKKGNKKPNPRRLVIIPGFGDSPVTWLPVIGLIKPVLRRKYDEIILVDFPGFGGFLHFDKPFHSMDLLMSTTADVLDSLKPHTVLGHSLGGWLTAWYLAECGEGKRPEKANRKSYTRPEQAIVLNPSGAFADEKNREQWESIFRTAMREGFKAMRPHVFQREPIWFRLLVSEFGKFVSQQETIQFMESVREEHLVGTRLKSIRTPTWVIWSENDTMIPADCAELWVREINTGAGEPIARGVILKDVGHTPQIERPAVTSAVLGQIFAERKPHALGSRWWQLVEEIA